MVKDYAVNNYCLTCMLEFPKTQKFCKRVIEGGCGRLLRMRPLISRNNKYRENVLKVKYIE